MEPFVGNDYRKRVLAAVEKRGGPNESDSFELYDLPIEEAERLDDAAVAAAFAVIDFPQPGTPVINTPFGAGRPYCAASSSQESCRLVSQDLSASSPRLSGTLDASMSPANWT